MRAARSERERVEGAQGHGPCEPLCRLRLEEGWGTKEQRARGRKRRTVERAAGRPQTVVLEIQARARRASESQAGAAGDGKPETQGLLSVACQDTSVRQSALAQVPVHIMPVLRLIQGRRATHQTAAREWNTSQQRRLTQVRGAEVGAERQPAAGEHDWWWTARARTSTCEHLPGATGSKHLGKGPACACI